MWDRYAHTIEKIQNWREMWRGFGTGTGKRSGNQPH